MACLGVGGRPHRQSSKNGLACLGAGGVGGGRIGSHPNTVWHWEACGVGGGRIGSHPRFGMPGRPEGFGKARAGGNRWPNKRLAWRESTAATDINEDCERHSTNSRHKSNLQWIKLQTVPRTRTPVNVDMQHPQRRPVPRAETTKPNQK